MHFHSLMHLIIVFLITVSNLLGTDSWHVTFLVPSGLLLKNWGDICYFPIIQQ